jgi:predicted ester cyclase
MTERTEASAETPLTEAMLEPLRRIFEDGFATGNAAVVDEVCAPDLIEHQFGLAGAGPQALAHVRSAIEDVHRMAPDATFVIEDAAACGDRVWVRVRLRGTASGPFFGPPSGRPLDITVFDQARIVDGRIVEHWGVPDRFAVLAQTGVLDRLSPGPAPVG